MGTLKGSRSGVTKQALLPLSHQGTSLYFYREKTPTIFLPSSTRIDLRSVRSQSLVPSNITPERSAS